MPKRRISAFAVFWAVREPELPAPLLYCMRPLRGIAHDRRTEQARFGAVALPRIVRKFRSAFLLPSGRRAEAVLLLYSMGRNAQASVLCAPNRGVEGYGRFGHHATH